jgi:ribosomal protein S18 acetylase RimI-like enzyme
MGKMGDQYVERDLVAADLPAITWSGSPLHLEAVARELERAARGELDYLAICDAGGRPVAIGAVDFSVCDDAGVLAQLAVMPPLQSQGLGTRLVGFAERRITSRGLSRAQLAVEENNLRARALYRRLEYRECGTEIEEWDALVDGG